MSDNEAMIAELETKLKARKDKPGYAANVAALEKRIAELKAAPSD